MKPRYYYDTRWKPISAFPLRERPNDSDGWVVVIEMTNKQKKSCFGRVLERKDGYIAHARFSSEHAAHEVIQELGLPVSVDS
jgi:hypothetical protein